MVYDLIGEDTALDSIDNDNDNDNDNQLQLEINAIYSEYPSQNLRNPLLISF